MNNRMAEIEKHFLNIKLNSETIDVFMPRTAILDALKKSLHIFNGTLLDVGCGQMPYREIILKENSLVQKYIGLDLASSSIHNTDIADLHWDAKTIPLENECVDSAMATEVLEHSFHPAETLAEISRVLKPKGTFFFTVPFIWPLHETPYDAYRYTPFSLRMHLENAGFNNIEIKSLGGWHASFAQMMGLWVKESNLYGLRKKIALKIVKILMPYLIKNDIKDNHFGQHCMITGLYGTAIKNK
jgi:SAM-dependent methyltransferase